MSDEEKIPPQDEAPDSKPGEGASQEAKSAPDEEINLEDIDALLAKEDKNFAESLAEVQSVEIDSEQDIEVVNWDDSSEAVEELEEDLVGWDLVKLKVRKIPGLILGFILRQWVRFFEASQTLYGDSLTYFRTRPKEYLGYLKSNVGVLNKGLRLELKKFWALPLWKRIGWLTLIIMVGLSIKVAQVALQGGWMPRMQKPLLPSFEKVASSSWRYEPNDRVVRLYQAFPQHLKTILLDKVVVNLASSSGQNPMAMMQFYASVDSKDTAIELKDRQKEFLDHVQRVLESRHFKELQSDRGKDRTRGLIRNEINRHLNQGRVYEIYFRHFVIKP